VAHIASFAPLGVAFMYLYRTVQASPQPCQPDFKTAGSLGYYGMKHDYAIRHRRNAYSGRLRQKRMGATGHGDQS